MTAGRNPTWDRDELILALDLYFRHRPSLPPSGQHSDVVELSHLLRKLPTHAQAVRADNFRNTASVYMKLANFRWIDPDLSGGYSAVGRRDREVWAEFATNTEALHRVAEAIRRNYAESGAQTDLEDPDEEAPEGRVLLRIHKTRERNRSLVLKRKAQSLNEYGWLACEVCGFDYQQVYGQLGEGFIECHHTVPLSELAPGQVTKLGDLALVCANCHRMIHRSKITLTLAELRGQVGPDLGPP